VAEFGVRGSFGQQVLVLWLIFQNLFSLVIANVMVEYVMHCTNKNSHNIL